MRRLAGRRSVLLAAGTAVLAAVGGAVSAQAAAISGTVEFEGGAVIPEGEIDIRAEGLAGGGDVRHGAARTRVTSDGGSRTIGFTLASPTGSAVSPGARIVARLERADGWLLARGSARIAVGSPVTIVLHTAMY